MSRRLVLVECVDPYDPKPGGSESYTLSLLQFLQARGVNVTLLGVLTKTKQHAIKLGFDFVPVMVRRRVTGLAYLLSLFFTLPTLHLPKSSIIHTQRPDYLLPFIIFLRESAKVCTIHGNLSEGLRHKRSEAFVLAYRIIENFCLRFVDAIIVVDTETKKFYERTYPHVRGKITVIPTGIDTQLFLPLNKSEMHRKYGFAGDDKIVIFVGRLEREKNLSLLIKSFAIVRKKLSRALLLLVGEGKERHSLEELAHRLKVPGIIFLGSVTRKDIPKLLSCADVFALTSIQEASPIAVKEAIACGLPVVSLGVGDLQEFVRERGIGTITHEDEVDFSRGLQHWLLSPPSDIRERCRRASKRFDFEALGERTIAVYNHLSNGELGS